MFLVSFVFAEAQNPPDQQFFPSVVCLLCPVVVWEKQDWCCTQTSANSNWTFSNLETIILCKVQFLLRVNYARRKMLQSAQLFKVHPTHWEEHKTDGEKTVEHVKLQISSFRELFFTKISVLQEMLAHKKIRQTIYREKWVRESPGYVVASCHVTNACCLSWSIKLAIVSKKHTSLSGKANQTCTILPD